MVHSRFQLAGPGAWAAYSLSGANSLGISQLYLAVVGQDSLEGKLHFWYEWTTVVRGDTQSVKLLVSADSVFSLKARRMIVKQAGRQAVELPFGGLDLEALMGQQSALGIDPEDLASAVEKAGKTGRKVEDLGSEARTVAGRRLEARRLRVTEKDGREVGLWLSPRVPFFSLVRLESPGLEVDLTGWGTAGAVERIGQDFRPLDLKGLMEGLRQPE